MAFALTKFEAYGKEIDEAITKRFKQYAVMDITGLAADVDLDIGDNAGTFWTAVGATEPGTTALKALKDIQTKAKAFLSVVGTGVNEKVRGTATAAGVYTLAVQNLRPNIAYDAADAPTAYSLVLAWELKDGESPVKVVKP